MHLAAESHVDRSVDSPAEFIQTNIVGTYTLLEASLSYWRNLPPGSRERFRFHHVSTDEVYGSLGEIGLFTEETAYRPNSPYSASKASSDHLVRAWHKTFGLPVVISNCSNNYGPFQFPEKLIPLMTLNALQRKPLPVYGRGLNVRDWLYVEDHARALADDHHARRHRRDLQRRRQQREAEHRCGRGDLRPGRRDGARARLRLPPQPDHLRRRPSGARSSATRSTRRS